MLHFARYRSYVRSSNTGLALVCFIYVTITCSQGFANSKGIPQEEVTGVQLVPTLEVDGQVRDLGTSKKVDTIPGLPEELIKNGIQISEVLDATIKLGRPSLLSFTPESIVLDRPNMCSTAYRVTIEKEKVEFVGDALYLRGENRYKSGAEIKCDFYKMLDNPFNEAKFKKAIIETNWDPCCIPYDMKKMLIQNERTVRGFSFGREIIINAAVAGGGAGRELIIVQSGPRELEIGIVDFTETSAGLSVPIGNLIKYFIAIGKLKPLKPSLKQGVLTDNCRSVDDYLGSFSSLSLSWNTWSYGSKLGAYRGGKDERYCNSDSYQFWWGQSTIGEWTEANYYIPTDIVRKGDLKKLSDGHIRHLTGDLRFAGWGQKHKPVKITGPRVQGIINFLKKAEEEKKRYREAFDKCKGDSWVPRRWGGGSNSYCRNKALEESTFHIDSYRRLECDDSYASQTLGHYFFDLFSDNESGQTPDNPETSP